MKYRIYDKNDFKNFAFTDHEELLKGIYLADFRRRTLKLITDCSFQIVNEALKNDSYVLLKEVETK